MAEAVKRDRVFRACEFCRKRKVKCDGTQPCANCIQNKKVCEYNESRPATKETKVKKVVLRKLLGHSSKLDYIGDRLCRLETLLLQVMETKLGASAAAGTSRLLGSKNTTRRPTVKKEDQEGLGNALRWHENDRELHSDFGHEFDADFDAEDDDANDDANSNTDNRPDYANSPKSAQNNPSTSLHNPSTSPDTSHSNPHQKRPKLRTHLQYYPVNIDKQHNSTEPREYFSPHSILLIFDKKSLNKYENMLPPEDKYLIDSLRNIPFIFQYALKSVILKWVDPPMFNATSKRELLLGAFVDDPEFVYAMIDAYYLDFFPAYFLLEKDTIKHLFSVYYGARDSHESAKSSLSGTNTNCSTKAPTRRLKISELLIMSVVLAFCVLARFDYLAAGKSASNTPESADSSTSLSFQSKYSQDELSRMAEKCFEKSIHYYYMILVISDGLSTVTAILYMVNFLEVIYLSTHINSSLMAVAIRFAQEYGLHKPELYEGIPQHERELRQRIWVICRTWDTEICFRSGKQSFLNSINISATMEDDHLREFRHQVATMVLALSSLLDTAASASADQAMVSIASLTHYQRETLHRYLLMEFNRIRAASMNRLFSDSVQTMPFEQLTAVVDANNSDLFSLCDTIPLGIKPRFFYDPNFSQAIEKMDLGYWAAQMYFFTHLMIVNRIPLQVYALSVPKHGIATDEDIDRRTTINHYLNIALNSARTTLILVENVFAGIGVSSSLEGKSIPKSVVAWNIFLPFAAFLFLLNHTIENTVSPDCLNDATLLINSSIKFFNYMARTDTSKDRNVKNKVIDYSVRLLMIIMIKHIKMHRNVDFFQTFPGLQKYLAEAKDFFPTFFGGRSKDESHAGSRAESEPVVGSQKDSLFELLLPYRSTTPSHSSAIPPPFSHALSEQARHARAAQVQAAQAQEANAQAASAQAAQFPHIGPPRMQVPPNVLPLPQQQMQPQPAMQMAYPRSQQDSSANNPATGVLYGQNSLYQVLNPSAPQQPVPHTPAPGYLVQNKPWMPMQPSHALSLSSAATDSTPQGQASIYVPTSMYGGGSAPSGPVIGSAPVQQGPPNVNGDVGNFLPYNSQSLQDQLENGDLDDIADTIFHSQVYGLLNVFFDRG